MDGQGNVYAAGKVEGTGNVDYVTAKYSPEGNLLWTQMYDSAYHTWDVPWGIALGPQNEVAVTGNSWNGRDYDFLTIKYSQYGPQQPLKK